MGSELQPPIEPVPGLVVRPAVAEDVRVMCPRLRIEDTAEIAAMTGRPPMIALGQGFANSRPCMTVEYHGKPSAMFGVVPSTMEFPRLGAVWLLGTDDIPLFSSTFLRQSKLWLAAVTADYDVVGNYVDERNAQHVRWIKWMGFKFVARHAQFGVLGLPFLEFVKIVDGDK
jgi:hypothetical protein